MPTEARIQEQWIEVVRAAIAEEARVQEQWIEVVRPNAVIAVAQEQWIEVVSERWDAPTVTAITPDHHVNVGTVAITDLAGTGFREGATVKLSRAGQTDITATSVVVVSPTKITCAFDVTDADIGAWTPRVTNPDAQYGELTDGFAVLHLGTGHPSIVFTHNKRAWGWRQDCWFGFGGFVDGKPALQVDPGYRRFREEWGLQYIQYRQHDPGSPLTSALSYAKDLTRISTEMDLCEGWEASSSGAKDAAGNKDVDGIYFAPGLYWWDLQHQKESSVVGAVVTGIYKWQYGAEYDVYYTVFPRGKLAGLLYRGSARQRSTGAVWLYKCATSGGTYSRVGSFVPDAQGQWRTDPVLEKGWYYGLTNRDLGATAEAAALQISGEQVANREYTFAGIIRVPPTVSQGVAMFTDPAGLVPWTAWIDGDGAVKLFETDSGQATPGTVRTVDTSGDYDSVYVVGDSVNTWVDVRRTDDGTLWRFWSTDKGETWDPSCPVQLA